jgi:signal transduction histidine kinase
MEGTMARILVVDDEIGMREGCRRALVRHGFQVDTAEHGVEGMRKLREGHFDLVLLDAMMPGMSGLEILDRICEQDPHIVCIMITGYATVDLAARAMKQGAHDFLPKPFTSDDLMAVVQRGLEERQRRLALQQQKLREEESLQLERTQQERAKLDAIESRFMLVVVHELRNPAGVVKNYLQMMRAGYIEDDELDEYLEKLDLRADQLLSMLDDLLELANLKGMLTLPRVQEIDVAPILEEVVRSFRPQAEKKGLELQVEILARPTMMAQAGHLRSLWSNLIDNAVRYTPQGHISVKLDRQEGQLLTTVSDTGIGISTDELTRIFQEFYRSEAAKEVMALGTGLGLPIVHQIVQIYHGGIEVDSTAGEGSTFSTFTVRLPLTPQPASN